MVDSKQQLEELLGDPGYSRTIDLLTREVMSTWNLSHTDARGSVLSAIGEPTALARIYAAWVLAKTGEKPKHAAVITRRRVLDLLGRDARRTGHSSLPHPSAEVATDRTYHSLCTAPEHDPQSQLECRQFIEMVRGAIACFASQGSVQERQAELLRLRHLEERSYTELSAQLACSKNALRVRVHAAMRALQRHLLSCHPELLSMRPVLVRRRNV